LTQVLATCFIALTLIFKLPLSETRSNNKALRKSGELTPVEVNRGATYIRSVREIGECDETEQWKADAHAEVEGGYASGSNYIGSMLELWSFW
jgi:hypothetical protein